MKRTSDYRLLGGVAGVGTDLPLPENLWSAEQLGLADEVSLMFEDTSAINAKVDGASATL